MSDNRMDKSDTVTNEFLEDEWDSQLLILNRTGNNDDFKRSGQAGMLTSQTFFFFEFILIKKKKKQSRKSRETKKDVNSRITKTRMAFIKLNKIQASRSL